MAAGVCKYCRCTETKPCAGGCAWTDESETLCTACAPAAETASELVGVLGIALADPAARLLMTAQSFDALPLEQQTVLVIICRSMVDAIRMALLQALTEDAILAIRDSDRLTGFLLEHFADRIDPATEESSVDLAMRLLEPHAGVRILRPGDR